MASFAVPEKTIPFTKSFGKEFIPVAKGKQMEVNEVKIPNYGDNHYIYSLLGVDKLHSLGYYGQNIVIGVFDTGFDSTHPALKPIFAEGRVVATYDFNSGDHLLYNNEEVHISDSLVYVNKALVRDSFLVVSYANVDNLAINDNAYILLVSGPSFRKVVATNEGTIEPDAVVSNDTLVIASEFMDRGIIQIALFYVLPNDPVVIDTLTTSFSDKLLPSVAKRGDSIIVAFIDDGVGIRRITYVGGNLESDDTIVLNTLVTYQKTMGDYVVFANQDSVFLLEREGDGSYNYIFSAYGFYPAFDSINRRLYYSDNNGFKYFDMNSGKITKVSPRVLTSIPVFNTQGDVFLTFDDYGAYRLKKGQLTKLQDGIFDQIDVWNNSVLLRQRGDKNVQPDSKEPYNMHGTEMLSLIGGFWEGRVVGIAPMAKFVLCKTERGTSPYGHDFENVVEEDFWVEALEFSHFHGARVISSSLGYRDWYSASDLDGETPVSSRMASLALSMNMLVVNAMGNQDHSEIPAVGDTSLVAPADARDIIAVGGCDSTGTLPAICSYGPSGDGRIKPEVVAPFNAYYVDSAGSVYWLGGTSVSTALSSGIIAASWSAAPSLSAREIRRMVLNSAVQLPGYTTPNNITGFGRIDGNNILKLLNTNTGFGSDVAFLSPYPNPVRKNEEIVHLPLKFAHRGDGIIRVFTVNGTQVKEINFENRGPGIVDFTLNISDLSPGLYTVLCHTGFANARTSFVILP